MGVKALVVLAFLLATAGSHAREMLVRVTFYHLNEAGSGYKGSTGIRLQPWKHCAVDNRTIRYHQTVEIPGIGKLVAVDTGSSVVSRKAAKLSGKNVPVVDVCVKNAREMNFMASSFPKFIKVKVQG